MGKEPKKQPGSVPDLNHEQALAGYRYLKSLLDNILDPIFVKNRAHQWVDGNKAFWELMGGPPEQFSGKTDYDIFPKDEADVFWRQDDKVFTSREPDINEEFLTAPSGKRRIISTKKALFLNEKGEEVLVGVIRDITAQRQLEELRARTSEAALKQKEQQYQSIFESTSDAILIFNRKGRLVEANPATCLLYGYAYDELIGLHGMDFVPPQDRAKFAQFMESVLAGKRYFVESTHIRNDATLINVEINGTAFHYAGEFHLLAIVRDITTRKQALQKLAALSQASERERRMYETALSNTADFNYVFDLEGRFIFVNKALLDVWEKTFEEAVGKNFFDLGYPPELAERLQRQIQQVIESKELLKDETFYTSAAGTRAYEYIFQPVFGAGGGVEAVAGSTRDITDLKEADRRKDEFLATLAHELRNPLAPIRNALEAMKRSASPALRAEAQATIERQLDHMVHLVDDLLDVSRITQGKIELRRESVALEDIIAHAVETADPLMKSRGHRVKITLPAKPIRLEGDFARLAQIFSNLLNNAAKYTNAGGDITLCAEGEGGYVTIRVRDNGIGIPPEMLTCIFEMFSQADSSLERAQGGLGIGLNLAKNLIEMHGGTITAHSDGLGKGSEFSVRLPAQIGVTTPEVALPALELAARRYRVLVVDDNQPSAQTMGWMMELSGHEVALAHDGASALACAKTYKPQVLLLDIGLPGMNGYEVCAMLRRMPELAGSVFIAQTGWGQKEHRERSKAAGFDYHFVKPVDLKALQQLLSGLEIP